MNNFDTLYLTIPKTKERVVGFIHDESASKTNIWFTADRYFHTNAKMPRHTLIAGLACAPAPESELPEAMKAKRDALKNAPVFKKGEIAQLEYKGEQVTARVLKGGKKSITVALSLTSELSLHPMECKHGELPAVTGAMAEWSVSGLKEVAGHDDSFPYQADVQRNGRTVLIAGNDGLSGPDSFRASSIANRDQPDALIAAIRQAVTDALGSPDAMIGPEGSWVNWDWYVRPTGKTFEQYLKEEKAALDRMG